ncbi:MAG: Pantothenate precursors transporter PanS [Planctomycetota bacterium]|jgi:BASS family bile acid:Na+ symporter
MDFLTVVKCMAALALVSLMFWMGLKAKFEDVLSSSKNLKLLAIGCLANFVLVPMFTLGLLHVFSPDSMVCVGFLILAVCPGAPVGLPFVVIARGDVAFAISQMIILSTLSVLFSPLLLGILLNYWFQDDDLVIDYLAVMQTLFLIQILPLGLGFLLHHFTPVFAERSMYTLGIISNLLLIVTVILILMAEYETLIRIRFQDWLGMMIMYFGCLGLGWICGGSSRRFRNTFSITTGVRNAAIALVMVSNNFPGTPAVTTVVAQSLLGIIGGVIFALFLGAMPDARTSHD